jgi:hypothetical protein
MPYERSPSHTSGVTCMTRRTGESTSAAVTMTTMHSPINASAPR